MITSIKSWICRNPVILATTFLFVFSVAIYAGALRHSFVWDDEGVITNAPQIREFSNIPKFFTQPMILGTGDGADTQGTARIHYYRPLTSTLHVFEYHFFGTDPLGYKVVNLLFNGIVVVCAFLLTRALTGTTSVAFLATLLYAANPVRGEVVYWTYSDSHIFAALFALLTLLAYHHGHRLAALLLMTAGLLFQEGAILVVGALLAYQLTIAPEGAKGWRRLAPFAAVATLYLLLRRMIAGSVPVADLDWLERLRAVAFLTVKQLQITFITDAPVTMYLYKPGMFASGGAASPGILLGAALFAGLGVWLWWRWRKWFFWYAWFVLWIALSFNTGGYADYLLAEKNLYLAGLGPCVLLTATLWQHTRLRTAALGLLLALAVYLAAGTIGRSQYWVDTVTYLEKLVEFEPGYDIARYQLGVEYLRKERYAEAIRQFQLVQELQPKHRMRTGKAITESYEHWGRALAERGDLDGALQALQKAQQLAPQNSRIYNSLGIIYHLRGEIGPARAQWEAAVRLDPKNFEARQNLERFGSK